MSPKKATYKGNAYGFTALDAGEPPHIHVNPGESLDPAHSAKFWIRKDGFELAYNKAGFSNKELNVINKFLNANKEFFEASWFEFFNLD